MREISFMIKNTLREKSFVFWTIMYPIILATFMYMAFGTLFHPQEMKFNVGMSHDNPVKQVLEQIENFKVKEVQPKEVVKALKNKEISGYVTPEMKLQVIQSGIAQTVIEGVLDSTKRIGYLYQQKHRFQFTNLTTDYIATKKQKVSDVSIFFYSMLAMVSFYGLFGVFNITETIQANISELGKRMTISPIRKSKYILSSLFTVFMLNFIANLLFILYVEVVLKLHLFADYPKSLILLAVANVWGISLGLVIGVRNWSPNIKQILGVGSTLLLAFLSGMMNLDIKSQIMKHAPFLDKINPAAIVSSGFYRLNLLGNDNYYIQGILILLGSSLLFVGLAVTSLRRRNYDSV